MNQNRSDAYVGLLAWLRGINGLAGGYFYDLTSQVFTRLELPSDNVAIELPYLAIPLEGAVERVDEQNETHVRLSWLQPIHGFAPNNSVCDPDPREVDNVSILRLRDDVLRRLLLDPTLGGKVTTSEVESVTIFGPEAAFAYGELTVTLRVYSWAAAHDLGSLV